MTILVLGDGLLGSAFEKYGNDTVVISKRGCNITSDIDVRHILALHKPEAVINCAGIVRKNPASAEEMFDVNATSPHKLAAECSDRDIKLVHISTNCVFQGRKGGGYTEVEEPDATDIYGASKLVGEPDYGLTIRTSFVGLPDPKGRGLLAWAEQQPLQILGYDHVYWNGVTTLSLVGKIMEYVHEDVQGIRHVYGQKVSKYILLEMANDVFGWNIPVVAESTLYDTIHEENKTLASIYYTGFIPKPLYQQLEELHQWAYQSQSS